MFSNSSDSPKRGCKTAFEAKPATLDGSSKFFRSLLADLDRKKEHGETIIPQVDCANLTVELDADPFTDLQKEDLIIEEGQHRRRVRKVLGDINEELRKSFRFFCKPCHEQFPDEVVANPMDLCIIEDKILANIYEIPTQFIEDLKLLLKNTELFSDPNIVTQKEIIIKVFNFIYRRLENYWTGLRRKYIFLRLILSRAAGTFLCLENP